MARVFITGSSDGLGRMAGQLLIEGTASFCMRETSSEGRRRCLPFLARRKSSSAI